MATRKRDGSTVGSTATPAPVPGPAAVIPTQAFLQAGTVPAIDTVQTQEEGTSGNPPDRKPSFSWLKGGNDPTTNLPVRLLALLTVMQGLKGSNPDFTMLDLTASLQAHPAVAEDAALLTPESVKVQIAKLRKLGPEYKAAIGMIPSGEATGATKGRQAVELNRGAIAALLGISAPASVQAAA
jgi:hypothetical protein